MKNADLLIQEKKIKKKKETLAIFYWYGLIGSIRLFSNFSSTYIPSLFDKPLCPAGKGINLNFVGFPWVS